MVFDEGRRGGRGGEREKGRGGGRKEVRGRRRELVNRPALGLLLENLDGVDACPVGDGEKPLHLRLADLDRDVLQEIVLW